jgi:hypothetical protein
LELGCGQGRASKVIDVTALDFSNIAIEGLIDNDIYDINSFQIRFFTKEHVRTLVKEGS